jgi:hypothetical protein
VRGHAQHQPRAAPPEPADDVRGEPGEHRDVQPGDRHQVGHARGAEHVPAGAVDGALVAGDQRGDHAGLVAVGHAREHGVAHGFPGALDGVPPCRCEQGGRRVACAGAHVAAGMQALLPHPQFAVEAVRVAVAVRRLEPHREAPALAGMRHG